MILNSLGKKGFRGELVKHFRERYSHQNSIKIENIKLGPLSGLLEKGQDLSKLVKFDEGTYLRHPTWLTQLKSLYLGDEESKSKSSRKKGIQRPQTAVSRDKHSLNNGHSKLVSIHLE